MRKLLALVLLFFAVSGFAADGFLQNISGTTLMNPVTPGGGTNSIFEYTLTNNLSIGAVNLGLDRIPGLGVNMLVAIDAYTTNCELRRVSAIAGHTLGFSALRRSHTAGARILWIQGDSVPASMFGAKGDGSTDDWFAVLTGWFECNTVGVFWDGEGKAYVSSQCLVSPRQTLIRSGALNRHANCTNFYTNNAFYMGPIQGHRISFTGEADDDTLTTPSDWAPPQANEVKVVFYPNGAALPAPLVAGRVYYSTNAASTSLQLSETKGGPMLDITADGSGDMFPEVFGMQRCQIENFLIEGNNPTNSMARGCWLVIQQQSVVKGLRVNNFTNGIGMYVDPASQQASFIDLMIFGCATNIFDGLGMWYYGFNVEAFRRNFIRGTDCKFDGGHAEDHIPRSGAEFDLTGSGGLEITAFDFGSGTAEAGQVSFEIGGASVAFGTVTWNDSDDTLIGMRCTVRKQTNYVAESTTIDESGGRTMKNHVFPRPQTADTMRDRLSGPTVYGPDGQRWTWGSHGAFVPFSSARLPWDPSTRTNYFFTLERGTVPQFAFKTDGGIFLGAGTNSITMTDVAGGRARVYLSNSVLVVSPIPP